MTTTNLGRGMRRKVRGDSKLDRLSAEQQARLRIWLEEENRTYSQVVDLVRTQFGVSVGKSAVGVYYQRHIAPKDHDDLDEAPAILAKLEKNPFHAATLNRARMLAWSALVRPTPDVNTATKLLKSVHRAKQQKLARARFALEQRRIALRQAELAARAPRPATPEIHAPVQKSSQNPPLFPAYFINVQPQPEAQCPAPFHLLSSPTDRLTHATPFSTTVQSGVTILATAPPLAA